MPGIQVEIEIPATPAVVWSEISDIASHVEWMADAESIEFIGDQESGVGTRFLCRTRIGPLRTIDRMTIVGWEPESAMAVEHSGLFQGSGRFQLEPAGGAATRFVWSEDLTFPWYFGGRVGAAVSKPILAAVWRRNLARLRDAVQEH